MEPIEPPWQAIKEWIADDEPNLDWFNRPRKPAQPEEDSFDQPVLHSLGDGARPSWSPEEIRLDDERILVLDET